MSNDNKMCENTNSHNYLFILCPEKTSEKMIAQTVSSRQNDTSYAQLSEYTI